MLKIVLSTKRGEKEMEKIPYVKPLTAVVDNDAQYFIMDNPIPSGCYLFVQSISFEDRTTGADAVRFGKGKDESDLHWWEEQLTVVANTIRWLEKELHIVPEGERVILRVDGATEADRLHVLIEGYLTGKVKGRGPYKPTDRTGT